ncbi:hypothetical protein [Nocardioides panacisoli]|uniref:Uncharacterized protein n=1 Tax=Nocardioides panacisoli TaxID=627624 RepID=A0ABP7IY01_9ACTN
MDDERELPTSNHPLHGEKRKLAPALLAVFGILLVVALVFVVTLWLRYNT